MCKQRVNVARRGRDPSPIATRIQHTLAASSGGMGPVEHMSKPSFERQKASSASTAQQAHGVNCPAEAHSDYDVCRKFLMSILVARGQSGGVAKNVPAQFQERPAYSCRS